MNTVGSISQNTVTLPVGSQRLSQIPVCQLGYIPQSDLFGRTADSLIVFVKNRNKTCVLTNGESSNSKNAENTESKDVVSFDAGMEDETKQDKA